MFFKIVHIKRYEKLSTENMYNLQQLEDTIAAISTPTGHGGIGIVRLSGKDSIAISEKIFFAKSGLMVSQFSSFSVHYGDVKFKQDGEQYQVIDEALVTVMKAPRTYTTQDIVEISCHGGIVSLNAILKIVLENGARLAEPGEFTKRAFLNGRIDLAQAEAVLDIINAKTESFLKVSTKQLKGELSSRIGQIREELMSIYTQIEAVVNFPEEDIDESQLSLIRHKIDEATFQIENLLESSQQGKILKDGIKLCICGKPNVGKSSLLNLFLKYQRAIVSDIAGTTRDTIEEFVSIKQIPFQIIDTAGILEPRDVLEEEAIKRSHMHIESSDLILLILDSSQKLDDQDIKIINKIKNDNVITVLNKSDLDSKIDKSEIISLIGAKPIVDVSVLAKKGVDALEDEITNNVLHGKTISANNVLVNNLRHVESLQNAKKSLMEIEKLLSSNLIYEIISEELKESIKSLDSITGKDIDMDLIENIFSKFCVGK